MTFYNSYTGSMDPKYVRQVAKPEEEKMVIPSSRLSLTTNPMHPKQLEEFGKHLNSGVKNIEMGTLQFEKFESIPKQHLEEIERLSKLTKSNVSMHGPLIDLSGFGEKGWSEHQREEAEQQMVSVLDRACILRKEGNMPIVFHSATSSFSQVFDKKLNEDYKDKVIEQLKEKAEITKERDPIASKRYAEDAEAYEKGNKQVLQALGVVNQETGELTVLPFQKRLEIPEKFGATPKEVIWTPYEKLNSINGTQWEDEKLKMMSKQKEIEDIREKMTLKQQQIDALQKTGLKDSDEYKMMFEKNMRDIDFMNSHIDNLHTDVLSEQAAIFDKFNKWAPADERKQFFESDEIKKKIEKIEEFEKAKKEINKDYISKIEKARDEEERMKLNNEGVGKLHEIERNKEKIMLSAISAMPSPHIWKPVEDFAKEKLADTVSNALIKFAEEHPDRKIEDTPMIALENWTPNMPMSTAESLRDAVMLTRKKFAEKLVKNENLNEKYDKEKAEKAAERLIGATWDMGHINQLRKAGYSEKELKKKLIEETQKIADVTKHVHITDNFGFSDAHLPPGMGNVPINEILQELEKKGFKGLGVSEVGGYINEFGTNPHHMVMEYFNSPMYMDLDEARGRRSGVPGYWEQGRTSYYTNMYHDPFVEFPQQHFNLYGSSFTTLPKTFGGQVGGEKSRFSDTPNQ